MRNVYFILRLDSFSILRTERRTTKLQLNPETNFHISIKSMLTLSKASHPGTTKKIPCYFNYPSMHS